MNNSDPVSARRGDAAETRQISSQDSLTRLVAASHLYGRSRETHSLSMALRRAAAGGAELVVLSGPAGIGKTSLVQQMRLPIGQQHGYFISGKFDQLQRDVPFSALVSALQDLVRQLLTESQAQTRAWRDAIVSAVGRNGRVVTEVLPALERIIGPQPPLAVLEPAESQNRFNHVFQNFLQVFCRENRPLVMFLDDVQWADPASLRLVASLFSSAGTHSLLLIASCRDNEIAATHPFARAVKELERLDVPVRTVQVAPLGWSDIAQYISDALKLDGDIAAPLAETIREKTGGNPFFMRQFLQKLQSEGLLALDTVNGTYHCDLAAIRSLDITENVADLIAQKIGRLDAATQRVVSYGAAIGNRFDLATLASVAECSQEHARALLSAAVHDHLLQTSETGENKSRAECYMFQHDRIQQAAYALVPATARPALNLKIGHALLAAAGDDVSGLLFEIVNHMNQGIALIDSRADRLRLAKLNLLAATRARNSTAYDLTTRACRSVIELLGWDAWGENYALALEAHARLAESQALMADFEGSLATVNTSLANARSNTDKARLLTVRTHTYFSMGDMTSAVACGRQAAQLFGLDLPERTELVREQLQREIGAIIAWSNEHSIESLLELPLMTDPERVALMSLLMQCIPPAYQVNPELFALISCKMVSLSIEHGNCPMSARGYGAFAVILSGTLGNFRDGDRFGKLGVDLCERLDDITMRSASHMAWAAFASAWVRPIDESTHVLREGVRWGLMGGDHPHASYCAELALTNISFRGTPLSAVRKEADETLHLLQRIGDPTSVAVLRTRRRFFGWLETAGARTMDEEGFDEAATLRDLQAGSVSRSKLAQFQQVRLMHRYFTGEFAEAWKISRQLDDLLVFVPGMLAVAEHAFYQCLSATAIWSSLEGEERATADARLDERSRALDTWAMSCPYNFAPLALTVAAERARIRGEVAAAGELYERAVSAARESGFVNIEALASELAMNHWRPHDAARSEALRERAVTAYEAWGAGRKASVLRTQ